MQTLRDRVATSYSIEADGGVVRAAGELDVAAAAALRAAGQTLALTGQRDLVFDISDVRFIDAAALGVLVGLHRQAATRGGCVRLVSPRVGVRRVLEVTRLDQVFDVVA